MKIVCIGDSITEGKPGVSFVNLLKKRYPEIKFVNLGKAGETVKSLHTRLTKTKLDEDFDLAFLWIGVNDVYSRLLKVQAQPITRNSEEFEDYYERVLELVHPAAKKVVVVSPAIIGETINPSNRGLLNLSMIIEGISKEQSLTFIDLHKEFTKQLESLRTADYLSTGVMTLVKDVFFYKSPKRIDRIATERGLRLTMDGIHLNSKGAEVVVEHYARVIEQYKRTT